jgi:hypothetical protein
MCNLSRCTTICTHRHTLICTHLCFPAAKLAHGFAAAPCLHEKSCRELKKAMVQQHYSVYSPVRQYMHGISVLRNSQQRDLVMRMRLLFLVHQHELSLLLH